jgi:exopolysaccharide production protein ExoQ
MLHTPPWIALLLTVAFIVFLFHRDLREQRVTGALWLPLVWMLLIGSRSIGQWLRIFNLPIGLGSFEEGSPLDALSYFTLVAAGFYILSQRSISLSEVFRNNRWLMAFLLYCFIAIAWSDFPFVAFKRFIKILGHPIMVLIVYTEPDPEEALARLMKRSAYVFVPVSIMLIKYFPDIGRGFDQWSGLAQNRGIALSKNMLGCLCLVMGYFFFWHLLNTWRSERSQARLKELCLIAGFLFMIGWLLAKAHSATSLLSMLIGMSVIVLLGRPWLNKRLIGRYVILAVVALGVAELSFGIFERIVDLTGHGKTIIGRAELWSELLAMGTNPIFGVGFESFWLGERLKTLWDVRWWKVDEAHNGYLEIYLNLGIVGLCMLAGVIIATFRKIRLALLQNLEFGKFRLGLLVAIVVYNTTESAFKGLSFVWFTFYVIAMDYPSFQLAPLEPSSETTSSKEESELAYSEEGTWNR